MPEDLRGIIQSEPEEMPQLLRAAKGLTADQLKALSAQAKKMQREEQ